MLLDLLENLVQWRFLSSGRCVPRLSLAWACVTARRAVLMGGSPDIPHIHIPGAITELADLADIHPVPAIPHGDFIVRRTLMRSPRSCNTTFSPGRSDHSPSRS